MSSFSWLDFSEADRKNALDVIDLFREKGTVDELGIGTVRDAVADILFPGTSTIMTRARYYLFVPWNYVAKETKKIPSNEVSRKAHDDEIRLIHALIDAGEKTGVIGIEAKDALKRLPSTIYWQGLYVLGIRRFNGSIDGYHRKLDRFYRDGGEVIRGEDGHVVAGGNRRNWDPSLPPIPAGFPKQATLSLSASEATYLRERITLSAPESLFAHFVSGSADATDVDLPWEHPLADNARPKARNVLDHAKRFSLGMHGAALLYNLMLAEASENEELKDAYDLLFAEWSDSIDGTGSMLKDWNRASFWQLLADSKARVPSRTRQFADAWIDLVIRHGASKVGGVSAVRDFIRLREHQLKHTLARLTNARALERWGGASSTAPLDYRWKRPTRTVLNDILLGEKSA